MPPHLSLRPFLLQSYLSQTDQLDCHLRSSESFSISVGAPAIVVSSEAVVQSTSTGSNLTRMKLVPCLADLAGIAWCSNAAVIACCTTR